MTVVPEILFKYKSLRNEEELKRVIDAIENHRIYAAPARKLNDPFEGVSVTFVPNWAGGSLLPLMGKMPSVFEDNLQKYRILSLAGICTSPQMWAHYADSYSGICLCLKTSAIKDSLKSVRYADEPMRLSPSYSANLDAAKRAVAESAWFTKQRDWSYEQEWRMTYCDDRGDFVDFGDGGVAAVIVGEKTKPEMLVTIREACRSQNAPLYKTYIETWNLKIRIVPEGFEPSFDGSTIETKVQDYCTESRAIPFQQIVGATASGII